VAVSAGNHAAALAYGAAQESLDCLVVSGAASRPVGGGAEVRRRSARVTGRSRPRTHAGGRSGAYRSSARRPVVLAGQGTVALELRTPPPSTLCQPTGGGGWWRAWRSRCTAVRRRM
jgi:threonine dehydratase